MNAVEKSFIPVDFLVELEEALRSPYAAPDPLEMAKACKQINRMRRETRRKTGDLEIAVKLLRDVRK